MKKNCIVLIGMAGAGKSTTGMALARILKFRFTDLDTYILEKDGKSIQDIIDTRGEEALLQLERQRMYEIDLKRRVIAPGGSIVYHSDLMDYLKLNSVIVFLDDSYENVASRLENARARGIIGLRSKSLRAIYDERRPLYSRYADITVDPRNKSLEQVIREILDRCADL